jgi:hypothetical protein
MNLYTMPLQSMNIYKYCNTTSKTVRAGINPYNTRCPVHGVIPLSKTSNLTTQTNNTNETQKMQYSRWVNTYGTAQNSGPAVKTSQLRTCVIGTSSFTY